MKSMGGEQLQDVEVTERGVLGDRAYALIDKDTGKVVSAKSVRLFPNLLDCKVAFVEPPRRGGDVPPVQILLPDGTTVRSDSGEVDRVLSAYFKRNVTLGRAAPDDFTIDQYHPDVEGADPGGNRDTVVAQKLGAALFAELGMASPVPVSSFFDVFPVSILTISTLARLGEARPQSRFDQRRFRMNVIVKTERPGFVENGWIGHHLGLGDGISLNVALLDPRCVMTTLAQDGYRRIRMFFGHSFTTTGRKSAISAGSLALGCTPWLPPQEQYGLVIAWYSTELEKVSFESGAVLKHPFVSALAERRAARPAQIVLLRSARRIGD